MTLYTIYDKKVSNQTKPSHIYHFSDESAAEYKNRKNSVCVSMRRILVSLLNGIFMQHPMGKVHVMV
jgi:hypothetical protein